MLHYVLKYCTVLDFAVKHLTVVHNIAVLLCCIILQSVAQRSLCCIIFLSAAQCSLCCKVFIVF